MGSRRRGVVEGGGGKGEAVGLHRCSLAIDLVSIL